MKKIILLCALFAGLILATPAFAQRGGHGHAAPHYNFHVTPHYNYGYRPYGYYGRGFYPWYGGGYYPYYNYGYSSPYFVYSYVDIYGITHSVYYNPVIGQYLYY